MPPKQIARFIIGFTWIYQGIFPKLFHIAPVEKVLTGTIGFSDELSYIVTKSAGVGEIVFGIIFLMYYQTRFIVLANIMVLTSLLIFVAIMQPSILIGAFNPVTTNLPLIGLSFLLLSPPKQKNHSI